MADGSSDRQVAARRLRAGRHGLSRAEVEASQRERLLAAMLYTVEKRGYGATTVTDVVARAAVSRTTFYAQFADKEASFLAAYDFALDHVSAELNDADERLPPQTPWRDRLDADFRAYLDVLADEPALAITLHQEVLAVGQAALDHRAQLLGMLAGWILRISELAHTQEPQLAPVPDAVFALFAGGLDELIRDGLRMGDAEQLRNLAVPLLTATRALLGG